NINSNADFMLISPETNNLGNGTKQVRFSVNHQYGYNGTMLIEVYSMDDNTASATKTLLQTINVSNLPTYSWTEFIVPLPATTDDYFAFVFPEMGSSGYGTLYMDDIYYEDLMDCAFPTGITVSNITTTSAAVAWMASLDPNATSYEYEIVDASGTVVSSGTTTSTSLPLNGLTSATTYTLRIRSVCGTSTGDWSAPV